MTTTSGPPDFSDSRAAADTPAFVRYLDTARCADAVAGWKHLSILRLQLSAGDRVLDVGCGTGDDIAAMAEQVGSTGLAVGVDRASATARRGRPQGTAAHSWQQTPHGYLSPQAHSTGAGSNAPSNTSPNQMP